MINDVIATTIDLEVGGKTLTFTPLTYRDWAELEKFCRFFDFNQIKNMDVDSDIMNSVLEKCLAKTVTGEGIDKLLQLPSGQIEMLYLALRRHHDLTRDEIGDLFNVKEMQKISETIQKLSLPNPEKNNGSAGTAKKKAVAKSN